MYLLYKNECRIFKPVETKKKGIKVEKKKMKQLGLYCV
jgi:hypothetical protein